MSDSDEVEWFLICNEKNITLKKNDSNTYKITFNVVGSKNNEDTVLNVLKNGQLFDLLYALNPDVVNKVDVIEDQCDIHHVFMTFKPSQNDQGEDNDKIMHVFFSLKYSFKENKCTAKSQLFNHNDNHNSDLLSKIVKVKEGRDFLPISKIKLTVAESNKKTSVCLKFKVDNKKSKPYAVLPCAA